MRPVGEVVRPALIGSVLSLGLLASCGGGDGTTTQTTLRPLTSSAYNTLPPVDETTTVPVDNPIPEEQIYTIQAGDFLSKIAQQFGVSMDEIIQYNEWTDGAEHLLIPGQDIRIPGGATPQTDPAGGTTTVPITGGLATTTTVATAPVGATYTIEAGDYLSGIATKFNTTVDAIVAANGWSDGAAHALFPGDVINLPA